MKQHDQVVRVLDINSEGHRFKIPFWSLAGSCCSMLGSQQLVCLLSARFFCANENTLEKSHCGNGLLFVCVDRRSTQVSVISLLQSSCIIFHSSLKYLHSHAWPYLVVDFLKMERLVTVDCGILFCSFVKQTSLHLFPTNTRPILFWVMQHATKFSQQQEIFRKSCENLKWKRKNHALNYNSDTGETQ